MLAVPSFPPRSKWVRLPGRVLQRRMVAFLVRMLPGSEVDMLDPQGGIRAEGLGRGVQGGHTPMGS